MPFEPYRRSVKTTSEEHGHKPDCKHSIASPCLCDGTQNEGDVGAIVRKKLIWAMQQAGWTHHGKDSPMQMAFSRSFGNHIIWVARVIDGWQHRWQRGFGFTITESGGFGSVAACLTDLWEHVVTYHDMADATLKENVELRLAAAGRERPPARAPAQLESVPKPPSEE